MMSYFSCRLVIWYSLNHACTINTVTHFTQRKSWTADTNWLMYFKVCFHGNNELYIIYSNKNKRVKLPTDRKIPTILCYNRFIIISDNHQCWVYDKVYSPKIIIVQHQGTGVHFSMELTHAQTNYCLFSYQYIKIIFNSYIITTYLHEVYFQSIVTQYFDQSIYRI